MLCTADFVDKSMHSGAASQPAWREAGGRCHMKSHKYHLIVHIIHSQAAFHAGPGWAPVGPRLGQVGPQLGAIWECCLG